MPNSCLPSSFHRGALLLACAAGLALAGCGTSKKKDVRYDPESFNSTNAHSRNFGASQAQTCEASRRALLSQGYLISAANSELVTGTKNFQPENEVHMEVQLRVVCAKDTAASKDARSTTAFVTALQDRYAMKKVNNSASVGVGMVGSLSLPYSSSEDAMVKVASQTVTDEVFYERFYTLVDRYLVSDGPDPAPPAPVPREVAPAAGAAPAAPPAGAKPAEPLGAPASMPAAAPSSDATK